MKLEAGGNEFRLSEGCKNACSATDSYMPQSYASCTTSSAVALSSMSRLITLPGVNVHRPLDVMTEPAVALGAAALAGAFDMVVCVRVRACSQFFCNTIIRAALSFQFLF